MRKIFTVSLIAASLLVQGCSKQAFDPTTGNEPDIEQLYVAAREVDAAILTGVTYDSYAQKVAAVTAKLLIAQDSGTSDEKRKNLLTRYALLIDQYRSALSVWGMGIHNAPGDDPRLLAIQQKYLIAISEDARKGNATLFEDIRNQIWRLTVSNETEIVKLVRGRM